MGRLAVTWTVRARDLRPLVLTALVVPQALALVAQGAGPVLLLEAPLLLLAMHPFEPWAVLVSPRVDALPFVLVLVTVRLLPYCADLLAGRWYGARALDALGRRRSTRRATGVVQRLFTRFGAWVVLLWPGAVVSVLAGATGMGLRRFVLLATVGLLMWAALIRSVADAAAGPLATLTAFIGRYEGWVTLGLFLALAGALLAERRGAASAPRSRSDEG